MRVCRNTSGSRRPRLRINTPRAGPSAARRPASMTLPPMELLPLGFHEWPPAAQAAALGLLTFVQEDVPAVGAALLSAAGGLAWQAGFIGCFLGIWMGDALLYLIARGAGRPLLERAWAKRFFDPAAVARSERWFGEKGAWLLFGS